VSAPDAVDQLGRQRAVARVWRSREQQERAKSRGLGLKTAGQHGVCHALQAFHIGITGRHAEERRLDQGQRPDALGVVRCRDQRAEYSIGVSQNVGARLQQGGEVGRVQLEVVRPRRARWIATPVNQHEAPSRGKWPQRLPRRARTGAAVDEQQLRTMTLASHGELRHRIGGHGLASFRALSVPVGALAFRLD
jgi:hypothetical protein